uniref:Glycosyltransferase n=1 Tax=viral metagenome TaxID=1070528 RepID=A0A6M3L495_9ZZZZ
MDTLKTHKITLGLPWYAGPDVDCYPYYFMFMNYFGRLKERSIWYHAFEENRREAAYKELKLPPLDALIEDGDKAELRPEDGLFHFDLAIERMSLPGLARERIVDMALANGSEWLFWWDADMLFPPSIFLRLFRHQKPVVNALAFTSRDPVQPCLYRIKEGFDPMTHEPMFDSETVFDIPDKPLISDEDIDGRMAFGAGVCLYNMNVFRQIPKPWFNSTGCGEDWFFCVRAARYGVPRYCDTSIPLRHKAFQPRFYDKLLYEQARKEQPDVYKNLMERKIAT